jgi:mRNA interferase HicA
MKKKKLIKEMRRLGWWFHREGGNHEIWTNGTFSVSIPRHKEIKENTAKGILKDVLEHSVHKE